MLLSAMQKGHFPFKKGTVSHHFKSSGGGARAPSAPPPSYAPSYNHIIYRGNICYTLQLTIV